jgi:hypothetical protein
LITAIEAPGFNAEAHGASLGAAFAFTQGQRSRERIPCRFPSLGYLLARRARPGESHRESVLPKLLSKRLPFGETRDTRVHPGLSYACDLAREKAEMDR